MNHQNVCYSLQSIQYSKTFDYGSDSDSDMEACDMVFAPSSYLSPIKTLGVPTTPSNIFREEPMQRTVSFFEDMIDVPMLPDYLTDEDEMDLACVDDAGIMILPRYSIWNPDSSLLTPHGLIDTPSLDSNEQEKDYREDFEEASHSSNSSTVAPLPCMQTIQRERAARRASFGKKALKARADKESTFIQTLKLSPNAKPSNIGALAA